MELYLSIPLALTAVALIFLPLLFAGAVARVGYGFAGSYGARTGFRESYWMTLLAVGAIAAVLWLIYGAFIFFVGILS